jgi:hypothetical protein
MRSPTRLPKLGRILATESSLQPLLAKTRELRALAGLVDGFFPADLARQVRTANYRDGELVLLAANSAIAAKLRLLAPSLCRFLAMQRWQVNSVSVRVQPNSADSAAPQNSEKSVTFSAPTLASLRALHARLGDSPAREALRALLARQAAK